MSGAVEGVALLPCPFCGGEVYIQAARIEGDADWVCHQPITGGHRCGIQEFNNFSVDDDVAALWNTRTAPPARSYADEDVAVDAAISAMGWTDKRMVEDARKIAAGFWFETYGFGGDCCLTGSQAISFRSCLDGARAAIRLLSQGGKA